MNYIFTTYLTKGNDPQRTIKWKEDDFHTIKEFYESVLTHDLDCLIFHDSLSELFINTYQTDKIKFIYSNSSDLNLIDIRWILYKNYLETHNEIENLFCLDISDVIIQNNPFFYIDNQKIYCGDEEQINEQSNWMLHNYDCLNNQEIKNNDQNYLKQKILNAGIVGGSRDIILIIINKMVEILKKSNIKYTTVDMAVLNYVLYTYFPNKIVHGYPVNTIYNQYEKDNYTAWFKHK